MAESYLIVMGIAFAVLFVGGCLNSMTGQSQAKSLNSRFVSLGNMGGKTYDDIVSVVGEPRAQSSSGGITVCTWGTSPLPGAQQYQVTLVFENDVFTRIADETTTSP
ncbi:hypothetical protein AWB70_00509 [Caballeronia cordobensis]|uniref:Uncharacterized protein n=1 Tax=Caballeronia cordobensis TaxID=1353886 RepID=A0A158F2V6_CABCO|nr:hypothetical protein [Caballeronia cordobensis]SAL14187.1 hypothetical protein AWB70_00509 [Caballeronia cordobensis]